MTYQHLIANLRIAIDHYQLEVSVAPKEEKDDLLRVAGHAQRVLSALESDDLETAKLELYAFSRQVSDSYAVQPVSFKDLAKEIAALKRIV